MTFWYTDPYFGLTDPESDPDSALFVSDLQDTNKNIFFSKFFCFLLFEGTFNNSSEAKGHKKGKKVVEIQGFLIFLHDERRIRIRTSE